MAKARLIAEKSAQNFEHERAAMLKAFERESGYIEFVAPRDVPRVWDDAARLLQQGARAWEQYYTLRDVYDFICLGQMQLWLASDPETGMPYLACVTEIRKATKCKTLVIAWIGGSNLKKGLQFLSYAKLMASRLGCSKLEIRGRKGFERLLGPEYRRAETMYIADLNPYMEN